VYRPVYRIVNISDLRYGRALTAQRGTRGNSLVCKLQTVVNRPSNRAICFAKTRQRFAFRRNESRCNFWCSVIYLSKLRRKTRPSSAPWD